MSDVFFTPKASLPEAPSNVTVLNITRNSVVLCWTESPVGRPFTNYGVEIMESGRTNKFKVLNISTEEVGSTEDCGSSVEVRTHVYRYVCVHKHIRKYNYMWQSQVENEHYSTVSGLIQLLSLECFIEITPDFLCPFMND